MCFELVSESGCSAAADRNVPFLVFFFDDVCFEHVEVDRVEIE